MASLKLITLNIESNKHWDNIMPFLRRENPDVLCIQEIFEIDTKKLAEQFGYEFLFIPITKVPHETDQNGLPWGPALFSKLALKNKNSAYYYKAAPELQTIRVANEQEKRETINTALVWATLEKNGEEFTIASNHFTWTKDGKSNKNQEKDMEELFKILDQIPELVLCGDFNIPRGHNDLYKVLAERFKDNIPDDIQTTLDINKHRVGKDPVEGPRIAQYVVDYIFSTPQYNISNVRCKYGLSDHCAIIADLSK